MAEQPNPYRHTDRSRRHRDGRPPANGREPRTALPVSAQLKARFAAVGLAIGLVLGVLAWRAGLVWLAIPLLAMAAWMLADLAWQGVKIRRQRRHRAATKGPTDDHRS